MKVITSILIFSAMIVCFAASGDAQTRKRPVRPSVAPTPKPVLPSLEVRTAREKVSNQRSNLTRFIDVLAPVAAGIEALDKESKTRKVAQKSLDANEANKKKVIEAIRGLRTGLVNLENDFRAKLELRKYLPQLEGIAALSAQSEDSALAGKFTEARRPLLDAAGKLSDTLAVMPDAGGVSNPPRTSAGGVRVGMTPAEARASSWGEPLKINRTITATGTNEQWVYSGPRYLYFVNGKLATIQN